MLLDPTHIFSGHLRNLQLWWIVSCTCKIACCLKYLCPSVRRFTQTTSVCWAYVWGGVGWKYYSYCPKEQPSTS